MSVEIKAIIFDFGGVISRTLFETHDISERILGLPKGTLNWLGPFKPEADSLWMKMQSGKISERDYWKIRAKEVSKLVGKNWKEMSQFVKYVRGDKPLEIIRPQFFQMLELLQKTNIKLAILSNELDLFYGEEFRGKLPFLDNFDAIFDATYTKVLKPNPKSYLNCVVSLGVKPKDCLFIDDQMINISGAQRVGLQTVHFDVTKPVKSYAKAEFLAGLSDGGV